MNKKIYNAPDMEVTEIECANIIATSNTIGIKSADAENNMESKSFFFDDDSSEE